MKSNIRDALETRLSVNSYLWPKNTDPYEFIETILKAGIKNIGLHTDFIEEYGVNKLKEESPHLEKSIHIINACKQRLRPIILTSLTTIFGLMPLAMGISLDIISRDILVGSRIVDWWSNLAVSIVFGLGFSTFITLILTPAVLALPYALRNDFKKYFQSSSNNLQ